MAQKRSTNIMPVHFVVLIANWRQFAVSTFSSPKREAASPFATTAMPQQKQNPRHRSERDRKCHYLTCLHHGSEVMSAGVVVVVASRLSRIVVSVLVQSARGCRCRCLLIGCLFATIAREAGIVVVAIDFTIITAIGRVRPSPIIARISSGACRTVAVVVNIAIARRSICIADTTDRISALGFQARSRHITFVYSWQVIRGRSAITISNVFKRIRFRSRGCC